MLLYNDIWSQVFLFFLFFLTGVVTAVIFDTFRATEKIAFSGVVFFVLKDILFWIITTFLIFFICLKYNDGEIRFFMFVGMFLGALVYFKTISIYVVKILCFIIGFVKKVVLALLKILLLPLRLLNKPVIVALSLSKRGFVNMGRKISFRLKIFKKFKRV